MHYARCFATIIQVDWKTVYIKNDLIFIAFAENVWEVSNINNRSDDRNCRGTLLYDFVFPQPSFLDGHNNVPCHELLNTCTTHWNYRSFEAKKFLWIEDYNSIIMYPWTSKHMYNTLNLQKFRSQKVLTKFHK